MDVPLFIASKSNAELNLTYSATSAIATNSLKPEFIFLAKRASSKSLADFPSIVTKANSLKSFLILSFSSLKVLSNLLVSPITDFGQVISISDPSTAT